MLKLERAAISLVTAGLMIVLANVAGAQEQSPAPAPEKEAVSVQGELLEVDTDSRMLVVRTSADTPMRFRYNDETEIAGAQENIAGLATATNARVTIHYMEDGDVRTAKKVEVQADERPAPPAPAAPDVQQER
jgi:hypothetical protein